MTLNTAHLFGTSPRRRFTVDTVCKFFGDREIAVNREEMISVFGTLTNDGLIRPADMRFYAFHFSDEPIIWQCRFITTMNGFLFAQIIAMASVSHTENHHEQVNTNGSDLTSFTTTRDQDAILKRSYRLIQRQKHRFHTQRGLLRKFHSSENSQKKG